MRSICFICRLLFEHARQVLNETDRQLKLKLIANAL
jgi:hypothetical protein